MLHLLKITYKNIGEVSKSCFSALTKLSQVTLTYSRLTIETLEKVVKYVQSLQ